MSNRDQSNQSQFKHMPAGTGPPIADRGTGFTYLTTGAETGGAFFMAEMQSPEKVRRRTFTLGKINRSICSRERWPCR